MMPPAILLRCDGEPWFFAGMDDGRVVWTDRSHALRFTGDVREVSDALLAIQSVYGEELSVLVELDADVASRSTPDGTTPPPLEGSCPSPVKDNGRTSPQGLHRSARENLAYVRACLRPSMADLARMLAVSRQVIQDCEGGKPMPSDKVFRLASLARAVDVLVEADIAPSAQLARRSIRSGMNLLDIVREGGNAVEAARMLVGILDREAHQRGMLSAHLSSPTRRQTITEEFGMPVLDEAVDKVDEVDDHEWIARVIRTVRLHDQGVSGFLLSCSMQDPASDEDLLAADIILCGLSIGDISKRKVCVL